MKKYLPSKKFQKIILVGSTVAVLLLSFFLMNKKIQYQNAEKAKTILAVAQNTGTLWDLITIDTDGDGVQDWQEVLWGTDKNKTATFDEVSDKTYIENKKKEMGVQTEDAATIANLTETEKFSRQFLASFAALKASGQTDDATLSNFSNAIGQKITEENLVDQYTMEDVKTTTTDTTEAKIKYYNTIKALFDNYENDGLGSELDIINDGLVSYSSGVKATQFEQLTDIADQYQDFASKVLKMSVPENLSEYHLDIINSANNTGIAVANMAKMVDDPVVGLSGLAQYQKYSSDLAQAASDLATNITQ